MYHRAAIGLGLVLAWCLGSCARLLPAAERPNVILILADDLGASELGCYGHKTHRTPHLDRLAAEGLRLDTFYSTPLCTPTRVALMTGQYGFRNGYLGMQDEGFKPPINSPLRQIGNHFTHADAMKSAGYATGMAGKWQLTGEHPNLIHECGFDEYLMWAYKHNLPEGVVHEGRWEGKVGNSNTARFWHPSLVKNGKYVPTKPSDYGPDLLHDFVVDFMRRHKDTPFFFYYTSFLTHGPHEETPDPQSAGQRLPKGFTSNLEYLDYLMGRLRHDIESEGLAEKTIILFVGDNGTASRGKGTVTELGVRVPFIAWGPGYVKPARGAERAIGDLTDLLVTVAELGGAKLPADRVFDGKSLVPLLRGQTTRHREWIYSHLDDGRILRDSNWLLEILGAKRASGAKQRQGREERFFYCGKSRDGTGYQLISGNMTNEAKAARERFGKILAAMPEPRRRMDANE